MSEEQIEKSPEETYNALVEVFRANDRLIAEGKLPISVSIIGVKGIGKTTVCEEAVITCGKNLVVRSLAQIQEPAELTGYKQRETLLTKVIDGKLVETWIPEGLIPAFVNSGYEYSGKVQTKDAPPEWVMDVKDNTVIVFDDFTRANPLILQAIMELINRQEMSGWNFRGRNIQIILNENPPDGNYNVASLDEAQNDRMGRIYMKWCHKSWANWAEKRGVDNRLINFTLWKPELFSNMKHDGISSSGTSSPRMMDKFYSLINNIGDLDANMDKITLFGEMTVGRSIVHQLQEFIKEDLDKLPTAEELIKKFTFEEAKKALKDVCGLDSEPETYKPAQQAIMAIRCFNYIKLNADPGVNKITQEDVIQYRNITKECFSKDLEYYASTKILQALGDLSHYFFTEDDDSMFELVGIEVKK